MKKKLFFLLTFLLWVIGSRAQVNTSSVTSSYIPHTPLSGTTCLVNTFPFKESFDGVTFPPACWVNVNTAGPGVPGTWDRQTAGTFPTCTPHSGAAMSRFDSWDYDAGTTGILVTPQLALPSDQYEVHFWMYRDNGWSTTPDLVNVYYNISPNTAGGTLLGTINRSWGLSPAVSTPNLWYEYIFNMPASSSGNAYIVFEGVSQFGNSIFIDDVKVKAIFNCPTVSTAELEPCGSDLNGGCNMVSPAFEPIALGETICGTGWCDGVTRDTDWFIFTLTETTDVTFTVSSEFPVLMGFIASPCPQYSFITYNTGTGVPPISLTATLAAGTYYAFVAPDFSTIVTCGEEDKYWAKLEMTCPAGSTAELEPCGSDLNGGCNMVVAPAFEPITLGETKCGTSWCDGLSRDTDWYIFTLAQKTRVTWTAKAEFPVLIGFINSPCPNGLFINNIDGPVGSTISVTSVLDPGTYYAWIGPSGWSTIIQCGGSDKYRATLTGNTCFEPTVVTASSISATTVIISWTAPSPLPGSGYEYEIRTSGAPGSGAGGLTVTGTTPAGVLSAAIFGLSPNTTYYVYVRSSCGGGSFSPWSTPATQFVTPVIDVDLAVQAVVLGGQSFCYDALETITVAGAGSAFVVFSGGSAIMIAGLNIHYLSGTLVTAGGYMHGYIAPGGPFCITPIVISEPVAEDVVPPAVTEKTFFKIYPNPTTGNFTLEQKGENQYGNVRVEVYGLRGDKVLNGEMIGERSHVFSLSERTPGIYFIHVASGTNVEVFKIIKY